MNRKEQAEPLSKRDSSCSQAVVAAFYVNSIFLRRPRFVSPRDSAGGMAKMAETCGALTGAFMVIGLKHGRTRADDDAAKEKPTPLP